LKLRKSDKWALGLIFLGFSGAAMFYSSYIGLFLPIGLPCVVCPHVFAPGVEPWKKFVRFTVIGGVLNAAFWLVFGGVIWAIVEFVKVMRARNNGSLAK
jgi:hypothetical protein